MGMRGASVLYLKPGGIVLDNARNTTLLSKDVQVREVIHPAHKVLSALHKSSAKRHATSNQQKIHLLLNRCSMSPRSCISAHCRSECSSAVNIRKKSDRPQASTIANRFFS